MRAWSVRSLFLAALVPLAIACGPGTQGGDDDDDDDTPGDPCEGDVVRCLGNIYEECVDGEFEQVENCTLSCSEELRGCVECDPADGNTCDGNEVVTCNADGSFGTSVETCGQGTVCASGECSRECTADGVDLIYVVDDTYNLLSFDPRKLGTAEDPFTLIGALDCPASGTPVPGWIGGVTPFSMSVDRSGQAWVLYTSGEIFHVDITDASCTNSGFQPLQGGGDWALFGMGFVTDAAGGDTERLWIGGGMPSGDPGGLLGYVGDNLAVTTVGNLTDQAEYSPEFTGTGNAELFGFFPGSASAFVQQIDKTSGAVTGPQYSAGGFGGAAINAWAFAHWGGKFYMFVTVDGNSQLRVYDRNNMSNEGLILDNLDNIIVGAGVSTCAPTDVD